MSTTIIHSARLVADGAETSNAWVEMQGGTIAAVGEGETWRSRAAAATIIDAREVAGPGAILTPGFVDIHGHGGGGFSYEGDESGIRAARALHLAHGTTRAVLSLVSGSLEHLTTQVARIAAMTQTDADILGSHLEGPFLDHGHRGAHDPAALRAATPDAVAALLEAGAGTIRQVTLAPELPGAAEAIRAFREAGVCVAVGHTDADLDATRAAFEAGATILTHAFNAMPPLHHRAPGPVGAATAAPRVTLEVIADGVHVHPELIRILFAAAPGRIALITDAMAAAGVGDGRYTLGSLEVEVVDGVARLVETGAIAGSTLTQDAALRVALEAGVDLPAAVDALTRTPAAVIGVADRHGSLRPGFAADAVVMDASLQPRAVWLDGRRMH
ncbi:MAG TPA: N-acetylglucosamine-6-phosphate deacetylase [Microbacterium sp.]|uniref:N-acetylglucosamine-6-phosphate deacetylase n=1 Tax=Microbacterium sp. UBA1097 TaxID=1946941 RepID=UPI000E7EE600|nr:N-acetylglucosamine-6-phosphate deacetylase [Microbacterium sp. UBA1097]HBS10048.1 N-acetylglucosamine-6-phosphate deacetylase [Microbacterium sp.]